MKKTKNILVSGASRGLGCFLTQKLLEDGHSVAGFSRSITRETTALKRQYPKTFFFQTLDATDEKKVEQFVVRVKKELGDIHCLLNNAAIGQDSLLANTSSAQLKNIISTNVTAPILLTRLVVRQMIFNHVSDGRIVNISSIGAVCGYPGLTVYSATKGALEAFTRSLAKELGERKILVNAIAPGFFESEMSSVLTSEQLSMIKRRTPTGVLTLKENIWPVLKMLFFEDTNITGQSFCVDGGASVV